MPAKKSDLEQNGPYISSIRAKLEYSLVDFHVEFSVVFSERKRMILNESLNC